MRSILGLICAVLAGSIAGLEGAVLGGLLGLLLGELYILKNRVDTLEKQVKKSKYIAGKVSPSHTIVPDTKESGQPERSRAVAEKSSTLDVAEGVSGGATKVLSQSEFSPNHVESAQIKEDQQQGQSGSEKHDDGKIEETQQDKTIFVNSMQSKTEQLSGLITERVVDFFTGNLVVKVGVLVLFFGFAFLIKYAAQRNLLPIEFRLTGVFISGLVLLGVGWRYRLKRPGFALTMQGGGAGVLYLVVFSAAKLYNLLPISLSLVVMVLLVALSSGLAVLQNSRSLAFFSIVGGFLAPLLMSTGSGNHVLLFSYYTLLNCGIFGIAWFKSWRILNLLGFVFTFGVASIWGGLSYRPDLFLSTEPFLVIFFLFYSVISVLFAYKQEINLRGYIDGPLVFGLPLIVSGLQYSMVKEYPFGMAYSSLALSFYYLFLAKLLWRRFDSSMRMLCEVFLALGVIFVSLAVPLALDGEWSASVWALEGGGMVWVGLRQQRVLARSFGLLLQFGAALIFVSSVWYPHEAMPFLNRYFLGCCFLSFAAFFSCYWFDREEFDKEAWEKYYPVPLFIFGILWWYLGGVREMDRQYMPQMFDAALLLFCSGSSVLVGAIGRVIHWQRLFYALLLQLPIMLFLFALEIEIYSDDNHILKGYGALAWLISIAIQYRILHAHDRKWPEVYSRLYHVLTLWLVLLLLGIETSWAVAQLFLGGEIWSQICWPLVSSLVLMGLSGSLVTRFWPVSRFRNSYVGFGGLLPAVILLLWMVWAMGNSGNPLPLNYIPFINPLEMATILSLLALVKWNHSCFGSIKESLRLYDQTGINFLLLGLGFLFLNSVVARIIHFYFGIPFTFDSLYHSVIFQAAIAALWVTCALILTVVATRTGHRLLWGAGALLLGMVVIKLFVIDLSRTGTVARIVSFLVVGVLMLVIGYFSPIPPKKREE